MPQTHGTIIPEEIISLSDLALISDALHLLRDDKVKALAVANSDLASVSAVRFSENDFGIPAIDLLIQRITENL